MKRASLAAAFAASLLVGSASAGRAEGDSSVAQARVAEERLLGSGDEAARLRDYQIYTREIAVNGVLAGSLDDAIVSAGMPAAPMIEARLAFASALDLDRDLQAGDRFYVRYEQAFTAEGVAIGIGRVMWAELRTKTKGIVSIHRFRLRDQPERLWLATGQSATPPSMRMPLETISVSSGFGLRSDPFEQPRPLAATGKPAPMGGPKRSGSSLPPGLPTGAVGYGAPPVPPVGAIPIYMMPDGSWKNTPYRAAPQRAAPSLFMHEGVDLVAPAGTPVYAAADGVVVGVGPNGRYGNWIQIDHAAKLSTVYGHLLKFAPGLEAGKSVTRGELIGFVGSTGRSTGAHLHFELQTDGKPVNPIAHPEFKAVSLRGADLERFRKQVARSLEERDREAKVITSPTQ